MALKSDNNGPTESDIIFLQQTMEILEDDPNLRDEINILNNSGEDREDREDRGGNLVGDDTSYSFEIQDEEEGRCYDDLEKI